MEEERARKVADEDLGLDEDIMAGILSQIDQNKAAAEEERKRASALSEQKKKEEKDKEGSDDEDDEGGEDDKDGEISAEEGKKMSEEQK